MKLFLNVDLSCPMGKEKNFLVKTDDILNTITMDS